MKNAAEQDALPTIHRRLMSGFEIFLPRYLRKHFHAVAVNDSAVPDQVRDGSAPLVVYANHASWWDPLIALYLRKTLFPRFRLYAPIDAVALEKYRIFKSMGFYGIEADSLRGAAEFLRRSRRILQESHASIWLTPEGRFCDVRDHSQPLMPGLSHLAAGIARASDSQAVHHDVFFIPVAFEITFWEERLPECLCWFGEPQRIERGSDPQASKEDWNERLTIGLRGAQARLASAAVARDTDAFRVLLSGQKGSWSVYDFFRSNLARLRGRRVDLEHGRKFSRET